MKLKIKKDKVPYLITFLVLIGFLAFLFIRGVGGNGHVSIDGYKYSGFFSGGAPSNNLDIRLIRWHKHKGYERVVFDVYRYNSILDRKDYARSDITGEYEIGREGTNSAIDGELKGYTSISATIPSFRTSSIIRRVEFMPDKDSFLFTITLKKRSAYKVFTLKHPTRIVIDIAK